MKNLHFNDQRLISQHAKILSPTHHFVDALHSPGLCEHPPGLLRVEPHTLSHIVPEGEEEIVKYSGTINKESSEKRNTVIIRTVLLSPKFPISSEQKENLSLYHIKCRKYQ